MNPNENDQDREEVASKPTYVSPHIHKIEKVDLVTHGSKDLEDDSDTGGYQKTKPPPTPPSFN
jgi:hypothetical protein